MTKTIVLALLILVTCQSYVRGQTCTCPDNSDACPNDTILCFDNVGGCNCGTCPGTPPTCQTTVTCTCPDNSDACPNDTIVCPDNAGGCNCGACPGTPSMNPSCAVTPTPLAPAPISVPPTPIAPTPVPPTPSNSGCIADYQTVTVQGYGTKKIKDLTIGDNVYTNSGFKKYIGNIHDSGTHHTLILRTKNKKHIEVTPDHLVKTNGKFVQAHMVKVDDMISTAHGDAKIDKISHGMSVVSSPLTQSGTIIVNDVVLSCYATDRSHNIVNVVFYPVRIGIFNNASKYFMLLINIHNAMPKWSKAYISSYSVTL